MKSYSQRIYEVGDEAEKWIRDTVKEKIVFLEDDVDDFHEKLLDLPTFILLDDYSFTEYGVLSLEPSIGTITNVKTLTVRGFERHESSEEALVELECLSAEEVAAIADYLQTTTDK